MREYEFIDWILHEDYNVGRDTGCTMEETKECRDHDDHCVKVLKTKPVESLSLYRYSLDDEDFIPFLVNPKDMQERTRQ